MAFLLGTIFQCAHKSDAVRFLGKGSFTIHMWLFYALVFLTCRYVELVFLAVMKCASSLRRLTCARLEPRGRQPRLSCARSSCIEDSPSCGPSHPPLKKKKGPQTNTNVPPLRYPGATRTTKSHGTRAYVERTDEVASLHRPQRPRECVWAPLCKDEAPSRACAPDRLSGPWAPSHASRRRASVDDISSHAFDTDPSLPLKLALAENTEKFSCQFRTHNPGRTTKKTRARNPRGKRVKLSPS